jgi:uncharacterized protein YuzE
MGLKLFPMKLKINHEADALYLNLSDVAAIEPEEAAPGIIVDYDARGRAVGIQMLHLSQRAAGVDMHRLLFETVPAVA